MRWARADPLLGCDSTICMGMRAHGRAMQKRKTPRFTALVFAPHVHQWLGLLGLLRLRST